MSSIKKKGVGMVKVKSVKTKSVKTKVTKKKVVKAKSVKTKTVKAKVVKTKIAKKVKVAKTKKVVKTKSKAKNIKTKNQIITLPKKETSVMKNEVQSKALKNILDTHSEGVKSSNSTKRILITAALPYVNNVPHLGNLVPTISADVYHRYLNSKEIENLFICGTDEHGTTTEIKAIEEGLTPQQLTDKYFKIQKEIYDWFLCDFSAFGRSTSETNKKIATDLFLKLQKNGYIVSDKVKQAFCKKCNMFLADRFVEGICPYCKYTEARGDQCENCGKLLDATELHKPQCKVCKQTPEIRESEHLFIDLPKISDKLQNWINNAEANWTDNVKTMTNAWMRDGLKKRAITRDLKWGIPVPGYLNKVFYSWFDAPIAYISITAEKIKDWREWWTNAELVQFMGKDNFPFHTIMFPSVLIGSGEKWSLVSRLSGNEYLNYQGGMFSKSRGIGVFGDDCIKTGIPADTWRYYLMVNRPERTDSDFSWEDFIAKSNNELLANYGNLVNRTFVFIDRYFNGEVYKATMLNAEDMAFISVFRKEIEKLDGLYREIKLNEAARQIMTISKLANNYFQKNEPWRLEKENKERCKTVLNVLLNAIKDLMIVAEPIMPNISLQIRNMANWNHLKWKDVGVMLHKGKINKPTILFEKLDVELAESFKQKYSGKQEKFLLDLRVAKIKEVKEHPKADKLYVLKVNMGEERQIVAGLRAYYKKEELEGKNVILICNLQPANLRGELSQGMLLAAEDANGVKVLEGYGLAGTPCKFEGLENNSSLITIDDFAKITLTTKNKRVVYKGKRLQCDGRDIEINVNDNAKIR